MLLFREAMRDEKRISWPDLVFVNFCKDKRPTILAAQREAEAKQAGQQALPLGSP